jgi:hypothetical protein
VTHHVRCRGCQVDRPRAQQRPADEVVKRLPGAGGCIDAPSDLRAQAVIATPRLVLVMVS